MKRTGAILTAGFFILLITAALSFSFAPYLINTQLIPYLLSKNGLETINAEISYLTPWNLTGNLVLRSNSDHPDINIPRISAQFSPASLKSGRIEAIQFDGLTIRLIEKDGKLSLRNMPSLDSSQESDEGDLSIPPLPGIAELIELRDSIIIIERPDHANITLNIHAKIKPEFSQDSSGKYILNSIETEISSEGHLAATVHTKLQITAEGHRANIEVKVSDLNSISAILSPQLAAKVSGKGRINADIKIPPHFDSIDKLDADIVFQDLDIVTSQFHLTDTKDSPLSISVSGSGTDFEYTLSNVRLIQPTEIACQLMGTYSVVSGDFAGKSTLHALPLPEDIELKFKGSANSEQLEAEVTAYGNKQELTLDAGKLTLGPYTLQSSLKRVHDKLHITKKLQFSRITLAERDLAIHNLAGTLSYTFREHANTSGGSGKLTVDRILYKDEDVAGISTSFSPTSDKVNFTGTLTSHLANQHSLHFSGSASPEEWLNMTFTLAPSTVNTSSLPTFISLPPDLDFSGKVDVDGEMFIDSRGKPTGNITFTLNDGEFSMEDKKLFTSDINTKLTLSELPEIRSSSTQHLSIGSIDLGNLHFTNGNLYFRIHSPTEFFLEKSSFNWCNGRVESGSLSINTKNPVISTTLYCDRLQFSELLSQLGISDTDGDGSLNGRLPIHFTGKEMVFDDGFLFSTPGNSGIVRFNNTAMLRQGMPDMGKAAYLEYSLQAMENFSYNWTKLTFNSIDDDLLIKMQIDGKPESPLPYGYSRGQLVAKEKGPGIQHPIRLDVNFHLPFAQMFKYGQNLQKIMENMQ